MLDIHISEHAMMRCRERLGLPRRAVRRAVERVWSVGVTVCVDAHYTTKVRGGFEYIFALHPELVVLVTVLRESDADSEETLGAMGQRILSARDRRGRTLVRGRLVQQHAARTREWFRQRGLA